MPNPLVTSFKTLPAYSELSTQSIGFITAFMPGVNGGACYYSYAQPNFNGMDGASTNDPGGLFGWLIYSRYLQGKGTTSDTYIEYLNAKQLVTDMNGLSGATYALVSTPTQGGTYGFFLNTSSIITGKTYGMDFLTALDYLAYGNILVIAGTCAGLNNYELANNTTIDALIGTTANASVCSWLVGKPYAFGIFPTIADSNGQVGAGYTMAPYTSFSGIGAALAASGTTFSTRIVNVCGVKKLPQFSTQTLVANTTFTTASYLPAVADVAGFFSKAKNANVLYFSIAGIGNAIPKNGSITNSIEWSNSSLRNILTNNRVNFFLNGTSAFLGKDLVGATASSAATTALDRVGPNSLKLQIEKDVSDIALKYLFTINNPTTRNLVTQEVQAYLTQLNSFIDPTYSQVICDETNGNVDNTNALYVSVTVKPLVSIDAFTINVSLIA